MNRNNINFLTYTHDDVVEITIASASTIEGLYPNSDFYVYVGEYDNGLSQEAESKIKSFNNTHIINWQEVGEHYQGNDLIKSIFQKLKENTYTNHFVRKLFGYDFDYLEVLSSAEIDFFMRQKPAIISDLSERVSGNIFYLDADVVLINRIDELFDFDFDVAGTVRSKYEEKWRNYQERLAPAKINAGVIVFNTKSKHIREFVDLWVENINAMKMSYIREQQALSKLFQSSNELIFDQYYNTGCLELRSGAIRTIILPCQIYNHFNLKSGINPNRNRIVHLKGGRRDSKLNKQLIIDVVNDNLQDWHRGEITATTN